MRQRERTSLLGPPIHPYAARSFEIDPVMQLSHLRMSML